MNDCCRKRENTVHIGAIKGSPVKAIGCNICKATWSELANPKVGPELLRFLHLISEVSTRNTYEDYAETVKELCTLAITEVR